MHDLGVELGVGRDRDVGGQGVQVGGAADLGQLAAALQLGGDGDHVDRLAATEQVDDRVVDDLVAGAVEVGAAQHLGDLGDRVLGDQHRAEHRLLGGHVLRRGAVARATRGAVARLVGRRPVAPGVAGSVVGRRLGERRGCRTR